MLLYLNLLAEMFLDDFSSFPRINWRRSVIFNISRDYRNYKAAHGQYNRPDLKLHIFFRLCKSFWWNYHCGFTCGQLLINLLKETEHQC